VAVKRADCLEYLASRVDEPWLVTTSLSVNTALWSRLRPGRANFMGLNMGLCTPFALGLALALTKQKVIALDSDGSLMVDTSALITVADARPDNLIVMVFDNESYARMGPTPTSRGVDLEKMAQGAGICRTWCVRTLAEFRAATDAALDSPGPSFVLAKVEPERTRIHGTRQTYGQAMVQAFKDALEQHPDYVGRRS
jgi:thiamine pyrophosphate-dependent acetolactate synthase large subunit-like protein